MDTLFRNWWGPVVQGLAAVIFGVVVFTMPDLALMTFVYLFGAYAIVDGVAAIAAVVQARRRPEHRWLILVGGAASLITGVLAFAWPGATSFVLLIFIAARALVTGVLQVVASDRLRDESAGALALALAGVVSVMFGLGALLFPAAGALAVAWLIGVYAVAFGVIMMAYGVSLYVGRPDGKPGLRITSVTTPMTEAEARVRESQR
jgi:uncharacterized membrane protein HdeD (DUF308 family)